MLFDLFDNLTVIIFCIEIILKWMDNFWDFWMNKWNIFDLIITTLVRIIEKFMNFMQGGRRCY